MEIVIDRAWGTFAEEDVIFDQKSHGERRGGGNRPTISKGVTEPHS